MAFNDRFNGAPSILDFLAARLPVMPENMVQPAPAQVPAPIDPTSTAAIPQPQAPVQVPQGDLNYFPPQPDANRAPVTDRPFALPQQAPQQAAQPQQNASGGNGLETISAFLQGLGRGNGLLSAIGGGLGAVQEQKKQNQTMAYLTRVGIPEGEAQLIAQSPQAVVQVLQNMRAGRDPKAMLELQGLDLDNRIKANKLANGPELPDAVQSLQWRAQQAGLQPGTPEYNKFMAEGGSKGITVDARNMGNIPQGYRMIYDANNNPVRMEPIPGGPADTTQKDAAKQENLSTATDVITGAAQKARDALNSATLPVTGTFGRLTGKIAETNSAEVRRQVETLKSNAKIENLQAMRAASPTGGALGAVSDSENAMLAAKAGSLDPDSPHFARDLDDYERSLLRTIHGKDAGDKIFEATRGDAGDPEGWRDVGNGVKIRRKQ